MWGESMSMQELLEIVVLRYIMGSVFSIFYIVLELSFLKP
jgi:hypothetical protein